MWQPGDVVVRREVRNEGWAWLEVPVVVVCDEPGLLATYLPAGAPFTFPPGPDVHPWAHRDRWEGHGVLMLQRPGDWYAVWVFWHGAEREFQSWYVNLQEPFRRTDSGYDTQDLELDLVVHPGGRVEVKDDDLLDVRVAEGRFTPAQAEAIRAVGDRLQLELAAGRRSWDPWWALWEPDPAWSGSLVESA